LFLSPQLGDLLPNAFQVVAQELDYLSFTVACGLHPSELDFTLLGLTLEVGEQGVARYRIRARADQAVHLHARITIYLEQHGVTLSKRFVRHLRVWSFPAIEASAARLATNVRELARIGLEARSQEPRAAVGTPGEPI
jgi:hypothetical protein